MAHEAAFPFDALIAKVRATVVGLEDTRSIDSRVMRTLFTNQIL
jgi:hypothetical protein